MNFKGTTFSGLTGCTITAANSAFPKRLQNISNAQIHELVYGANWQTIFQEKNYDPDFIENKLGYQHRYWSHIPGTPITENELTSADLMIAAAEKTISTAGIPIHEIDMFIAVTVTSPKYTNSMGAFVAGKLGLSCPAIEIKTGCASAIFAMVMGAQFIRSGARHVLIAAGETPTKVTGKLGNLIYAVGDGGAAVMMSKSDDESKGIATAFLGTEGKLSGAMGSIGLLPPNQADLDAEAYNMIMGKDSDAFIQKAWQQIPGLLYKNSGFTHRDIDLLIPHQVNKNIWQLAVDASGIPGENAINLIAEYANCGSVGVLLALAAAFDKPKALFNKKLMLIAVGGGVSYGGLIVNL